MSLSNHNQPHPSRKTNLGEATGRSLWEQSTEHYAVDINYVRSAKWGPCTPMQANNRNLSIYHLLLFLKLLHPIVKYAVLNVGAVLSDESSNAQLKGNPGLPQVTYVAKLKAV